MAKKNKQNGLLFLRGCQSFSRFRIDSGLSIVGKLFVKSWLSTQDFQSICSDTRAQFLLSFLTIRIQCLPVGVCLTSKLGFRITRVFYLLSVDIVKGRTGLAVHYNPPTLTSPSRNMKFPLKNRPYLEGDSFIHRCSDPMPFDPSGIYRRDSQH